MLFGCRHKWIEVNRYFIGPVERRVDNVPQALVYRLLHGYTVIEFRCTKCGVPKSDEVSGDATEPRHIPDYLPDDM